MKLSKLYSNYDVVFKPICFNEGFNVIYGKVKRPKETDRDSHNLGKTLLISLIDFVLLKELTQGHFLYDNKSKFRNMEFYLEILTNSGKYLTIKRSVEKNSKISIKSHNEKYQNFTMLGDADWNECMISIRKAIQKVDFYLSLDAIKPWSYRKGVSYFLRTQGDYLDEFQISKYSKGKHADWKPYLAKILGFDDKLLQKKYEFDEIIDKRKEYKAEFEKRLATKAEEYDKLKGAIEVKQSELEEASKQLDKFDFYENELKINIELVEKVESEISELNDNLYNVKYEIEQIQHSLSNKVNFNFSEIKELYKEVKIYFKDELSKSYEELVEFNNSLYGERHKFLKDRLQKLQDEKEKIESRLKKLNQQREDYLKILRGEDTFSKFKSLQKLMVQREAELVRLQAELDSLNSASVIQKEIEGYQNEQKEIINKIDDLRKKGNPTYTAIRLAFNKIIKEVLNLPALLSTRLNDEGNLEFEANIVTDEETGLITSQGKGTSYKKFLCAAFDLSVLETYHDKSFFRFVYHDGMLEGLDNRKKIKFLALVRRFCEEFGLQYILTVIQSDLPRDANDNVIPFEDGEIIRQLHDEGDTGRLFNMPSF